jgi:hypothetical protein
MANNLVKNEINDQNFWYSGSRPRPVAASAADADIVIVVGAVVVCESCRAV